MFIFKIFRALIVLKIIAQKLNYSTILILSTLHNFCIIIKVPINKEYIYKAHSSEGIIIIIITRKLVKFLYMRSQDFVALAK